MNDLSITRRRADLDWLRVIAFGLLIWFHAAVVFLPSGIPMIQNAESSTALQVFVAFLHQFRLALLFLISGVGVRFAMKKRGTGEFVRERSKRLLIPLAVGILALVPPMVYLEKRFIGEIDVGIAAFYPAFFVNGVYPSGHLSWHHFWFLAYLFLFCMLGLPFFRHLTVRGGDRLIRHWTQRLTPGARLFLPIIPLALFEMALRWAFPGIPDLLHDWANFAQWFLIFVAGFMFASSEPLLDRTQALRYLSLTFGIATSGLLFLQFWDPAISGFTPLSDGRVTLPEYLWFCALRVANIWCWLLACLGWAGAWLQRPNRLLGYLNGAVYPLFCWHLPIILALAYLVVPLDWPVVAKYTAIVGGTMLTTFALYEAILRRVRWLRPLFGIR